MKRYFKDILGKDHILYYEYVGEYNIRQVEIENGRWNYATEQHRKDYLADQPLSRSDSGHEDSEISSEEFEAVWQEALKHAQ